LNKRQVQVLPFSLHLGYLSSPNVVFLLSL
jgi:hypothetical protein